MEERRSQKNKAKLSTTASTNSEEMSEQEEDLIRRMYGLVGDRWDLIAGRIPGRKAEEIERFWIMRHGDAFSLRRTNNQQQQQRKPNNS
ncbi:transcription factor CPC-like isoform X2 [Arachis stenosperma]|uniref:transcription factor CPC-like isoform X2 n=1 Tax=Arachis stenosperma TaxID=217475 RepID=UPI0025ABDAFF|nr:transcription factor CPC-like isoform X2 [Arachis stenosperma]